MVTTRVTIFGATEEELRDPEFIMGIVEYDDWELYDLKTKGGRMIVRLRLEDDDTPPPRRSMKPNLLDALTDPRLFAKFFPDPESWVAWTALSSPQPSGFRWTKTNSRSDRKCTGRTDVPTAANAGDRACRRATWGQITRPRPGSRRGWRPLWTTDPTSIPASVVDSCRSSRLIADQARIVLRSLVKAFSQDSPCSHRLVERDHQWALDLSNSVSV